MEINEKVDEPTMRPLSYYVKALELCRAMEEAGLASLTMPERNIFLSSKIPERDLTMVVEAVGVYVRVHRLMGRMVLGLKAISVCAVISILLQLNA